MDVFFIYLKLARQSFVKEYQRKMKDFLLQFGYYTCIITVGNKKEEIVL